MNQATIELTPEQAARIVEIEARVKALSAEVTDLSAEITVLKEAGLETGEAAESVHDLSTDTLVELRRLRVSRGISAFSEWWFDRVLCHADLDSAIAEIPDDDPDAHAWRAKYAGELVVDRKIAEVDPELGDVLHRAGVGVRGTEIANVSVSMQLVTLIGMTEAELEDRAEVALTQLIGSGWRP